MNYVMTDVEFRDIATEAILDYWNNTDSLVKQYGVISASDVYCTWSCKAIENFKGLFGVNRDGDGLYFELTYHDAKKRCYLDIYQKTGQVIVNVD